MGGLSYFDNTHLDILHDIRGVTVQQKVGWWT
jgi:hypothetical protein